MPKKKATKAEQTAPEVSDSDRITALESAVKELKQQLAAKANTDGVVALVSEMQARFIRSGR